MSTDNDLVRIRDGLFRTLTTYGPYSSGQISACGFDVLEGSNACAVTYFPGGESNFDVEHYDVGDQAHYQQNWMIEGSIWIKDTGDPQALLGRVWRAPGEFLRAIARSATLDGSCDAARVRSIRADVENAFEVSGQIWQRITWRIEATVV